MENPGGSEEPPGFALFAELYDAVYHVAVKGDTLAHLDLAGSIVKHERIPKHCAFKLNAALERLHVHATIADVVSPPLPESTQPTAQRSRHSVSNAHKFFHYFSSFPNFVGRLYEPHRKAPRSARGQRHDPAEVAEYPGTSQTMYARCERAANELPFRHFAALCRLYNVSADYPLDTAPDAQGTRCGRKRKTPPRRK